MTKEERDRLTTSLRSSNPYAQPAAIMIYVDALAEYRHAQAEIEKHGTVMVKNGTPIENPYLKVRDRAAKMLLATRIKTKELP